MIILDTSIWIEFLRQRTKDTNEKVSSLLEDGGVVALSPVFGELLQGSKNEKEEKIILTLWENLPKVNEMDLLIRAGQLSSKKKLLNFGVGLIDCTILQIALEYDFSIWSKDKNLCKAASGLKIEIID